MRITSTLAAVAALAGAAAAAISDRNNVVMYWGQGSGQGRLKNYCEGGVANIINIGFMDVFPEDGNGYGGTNFGNQCWSPAAGYVFKGPGYVDENGVRVIDESKDALLNHCETMAEDIQYCQGKGIKILLSLGGATTKYKLTKGAAYFARHLWLSFGPKNERFPDYPRPFDRLPGSYDGELVPTVVDGFDLDIEHGSADQDANYVQLVHTLRGFMEQSAQEGDTREYIISGAPQCTVAKDVMYNMIQGVKFDLINVQFYNTPQCSLRNWITKNPGTSGTKKEVDPSAFTFDAWTKALALGASKDAKLTIGMMGSGSVKEAGDPQHYLNTNDMKSVIDAYFCREKFAGIMIWDAVYADTNKINGLGYQYHVKDKLNSMVCLPAGLSTSPDGSCGNKYSCYGFPSLTGYSCCNKYGQCGSSLDDCTGCKESHSTPGKCNVKPSTSSLTIISSTSKISSSTSTSLTSTSSTSTVSSTTISTSTSTSSSSSSSTSSSSTSTTSSTSSSIPSPTALPGGLTTSPDGTCGNKYSCEGFPSLTGYSCCNKYGQCGSSIDDCTGCKESHSTPGKCNVKPSTTSSSTSTSSIPIALPSGLTTSPDGSCGNKYSCQGYPSLTGYSCCNKYGRCGNTADDCTGCKESHSTPGKCNVNAPSSTTTPVPAPSSTLVTSPDGSCGNKYTCNGYASPFAYSCCNAAGRCGSSAADCTGCKESHSTPGKCNAKPATTSPTPVPTALPSGLTTSPDGSCGNKYSCQGFPSLTGYSCCNKYGRCGSTADDCTGCKESHSTPGKCNVNKPSSTTTPVAPPSSTLVTSPDGSCGNKYTCNGYANPFGYSCCNAVGRCGSSAADCTGCKESHSTPGKCNVGSGSATSSTAKPATTSTYKTSPDGSCGNLYTCNGYASPLGYSCCNAYGRCGSSAADCTGCKESHSSPGFCNKNTNAATTLQTSVKKPAATPSSAPPAKANLVRSPNGSCGNSYTCAGYASPVGYSCCNQYGYCGSSATDCGAGCKKGYGACF